MKKREHASIMQIANDISTHASVQLGEKQRGMILSRLRRRMQALGLKTEDDYVDYYIENHDEEFKELLSLLTTHHTFFFREFKQFEHLRDNILPKLLPKIRARADRTLRLWSAACSRGHEVYSLAMFLDLFLRENAPDVRLNICGTDVDGISVDFASNGVFLKRELDSAPLIFQAGNFLRGSSGLEEFVKVHPRIRAMCSFATGNLADTQTWPAGSFDIIFCRNVFIYFSAPDIGRTIVNMKNRLSELGTVFLGLTESINGVTNVLTAIGPSVYGRDNEWMAKAETKVRPGPIVGTTREPLKLVPPADKRVLCVDDSPIVLKLLGEIFGKGSGFTVRDTASNGKIAAELLAKNKYDLITLDIHMPHMTGLEFMQTVYRPDFPPVIVVSSVDRTDNSLALEMMRLGAKDYVQKPALKDFERYKDEFLIKANSVCKYTQHVTGASVDQLFARSGTDAVRGRVGLYFREKDWRRALDFIQANQYSGLSFDIVYIEEASADKTWLDRFTKAGKPMGTLHRQRDIKGSLYLPKMDVAVVLSGLSPEQLAAFRFMKKSTYLAEEAFPRADQSVLDNFDLFPSASLSYIVKKSLIEIYKKGA